VRRSPPYASRRATSTPDFERRETMTPGCSFRLKVVRNAVTYPPMAKNPAWPREICPAYPMSMQRPTMISE
jgi:hypothetical protein